MAASIPSAEKVRAELSKLGHAQLLALAELSGVHFNTLWRVRGGTTANPGIETVRKFLPHIKAARAA